MSDTQRFIQPLRAPEIPGLQLLTKSGETSTAVIWRANQISLERPVSVWILKPEAAAHLGLAKHFDEISRAVAKIRHTNLLQIIDIAHTADGLPYVLFENVEGHSIYEILKRGGKIDQAKAAGYVLDIANALDAAWKQSGFIHRNIKPENLLLANGEKIKIANFNTATLVQPGENPLAYDDDMFVGTPNYASPEQIDCLPTIDFHTDMYSLGAVFYQMVTGTMPFAGEDDPHQIFELQKHGTLPNPRTLNHRIKPGFAYIIQKMMAKSPQDRYQWWQDVIEDLERVLAGRNPFSKTGTLVAPVSTVALPQTIAGATAAAHAQNGASVSRSTTGTAGAPAKRGPGAFAMLLAVLLLAGGMVWLTQYRVKNLAHDARVPESPADTNQVATVSADSENVAVSAPADSNQNDTATDDYNVRTIATSDTETANEAAVDTATSTARTDDTQSDTAAVAQNTTADDSSDPWSSWTTTGDDDSEQSDTALEAAPATDAASAATTAQDALLNKLYAKLKTSAFDETREFARTEIAKAVKEQNLDKDANIALWNAFRDAAPELDIIGDILVSYKSQVTFGVNGKPVKMKPMFCTGGILKGQLLKEDGTRTDIAVNLADMTDAERYKILTLSKDTAKKTMLTKAFKALKLGKKADFDAAVRFAPELKVFARFLDNE